jgi:hypothetical protein
MNESQRNTYPIKLWLFPFYSIVLVSLACASATAQDIWVHLNSAPSSVTTITTDPEGDIYAGTDTNGIFYSIDHGEHWVQLNAPFAYTSYIRNIGVDSEKNIFVAADSGVASIGDTNNNSFIARSTDDGETWDTVLMFREGSPLGGPNYLSSFGISRNGNIIAAAYWQIFTSTDKGMHWITSGSLNGTPWDLTMAKNGDLYIAWSGGGSGLEESTDNGLSWKQISSLPADAVAVNSKGYIFLGLLPSGMVVRSTNNGQDWPMTSFPYPNDGVEFDGIASNSRDRIYASGAEVYYSSDDGNTWHQCNVPAGTIVGLDSSDYVYVQTAQGLYRGSYISTLINEPSTTPSSPVLIQNYPNPFNHYTNVRFQISQSGAAALKIYNALGQRVATLVSGEYTPGLYSVRWAPAGLQPGVYYSRLESGGHIEMKKLVFTE